ncbi:hypothetical protein FGB62_258g09 [Gracilaria domingensis]|nr:hypothetical protein FGB62_258g09 [Gracilaria domingensis]
MKVNNSVIDNEFFECEVPFRFNSSRLLNFKKWFKDEEPWLKPRHPANASVRCMIPFLAQCGRIWIEDCDYVKNVVEQKIQELHDSNSTFLAKNALQFAKMQRSGRNLKREEERMDAKWSNAWSTIFLYQALRPKFRFKHKFPMPFGCYTGYIHGKPGFTRYEAKIKRVIENLPEQLFEEESSMKVIQGISAFHIESFALFLQPELLASSNEQSAKGSTLEILSISDIYEMEREYRENSNFSNLETNFSSGSSDILPYEPSREYSFDEWQSSRSQNNGSETQAMEVASGRETVSSEQEQSHHSMALEGSEHNAMEVESDQRSTDCHSGLRMPKSRNFSKWSYERACLMKHLKPLTYRMLPNLQKAFESANWVGVCSEKSAIEFTVHLENVFSIFIGSMNRCNAGPVIKRDPSSYYKVFCKRSASLFLDPDEKKVPSCRSQHFFWKLWNIPKCAPPALRDVDPSRNSVTCGIKFMGYIMETVRDCLARWTAEHAADNIDANVWKPEIRTFVQLDASDDLSRLLSDYLQSYVTYSIGAVCERIIWEYQKQVLHMLRSGTKSYGPSDVELMLMCMLGFPSLRVTHRRGQDEILVEPQHASRRFELRIKLKSEDSTIKRVMHESIVINRGTESTLLPVQESTEENSPEKDDKSDFHNLAKGKGNIGNDVETNCGPREERFSVASTKTADVQEDVQDITEVVDETESDKDGVLVCAGCSCGVKYKLNTKAERIPLMDDSGAEKYYWEWEGWKAQREFNKDRYPLLHAVHGTKDRLKSGTHRDSDTESAHDEVTIHLPEESTGSIDYGVAMDALSIDGDEMV